MSRIFISYRRIDSEGYVGRLYDHLIQQFPLGDIFMDVDDILPGQDFVKAIEDAINGCDVVLAVIGPQWLTITDDDGQRRLEQWDDFVRLEIATALRDGKVVIPILVQNAPMPRTDDLPDNLHSLTRRNALTLSHHSFAYDVSKLVEAIRQLTRPKTRTPRPDTPERRQKKQQLDAIRDQVLNLTDSPLYEYRVQNHYIPVAGEGDPDARIMLIGEAPGQYEAEQGRPFVGPSGEILVEMLNNIGLERDDVYMTNILKDRAPQNRDPEPKEIEIYAPFLEAQLAIIEPDVIVTLGRFAMTYILKKYDLPDKRGTISKLHGKLMQATAPYGNIYILPMFHPAVAIYTGSKKDILRQDFEKLRMFV